MKLKFNKIIFVFTYASALFCINMHAMQPADSPKAHKKKFRPKGPNVSPLLLTVLEKETEKAHLNRIQELKKQLPEKLNRLYALALPAHMLIEDQEKDAQEPQKELDVHEKEALREAQFDAIIQVGEYQRYKFLVENSISPGELRPYIVEFKKSKGFLKKPKIETLHSVTLSRFYATYYALTHALKHIHLIIEPK